MPDPWGMLRALVQAADLSPQAKARNHQARLFRRGGQRIRSARREEVPDNFDWHQVSMNPASQLSDEPIDQIEE